MANRFLNNITINDEYTLPSADGTADQIIKTNGAGQLSFVDQSTIASGSAEVVEVPVKNLQGSALTKGDPVYISGSVGASGILEVQLADAGNAAKMPAVGLLKQDLAINGEGFAVVTGKLRNLVTSPIDGVTPNPNTVIYVKSGGTTGAALTTVKPTGSSNLIQNMGKVGRVSTVSDGTLVVSSILRSNDIPNLSTGKIWVGDGNTTESTVVHLDETNGRMGIGTASPGTKLHVDSSSYGEIAKFGNGSVQLSFGMQSTYGYINAQIQGATFRNLCLSTNGGNVGIGTTNPGAKLHVSGGAIRIDDSQQLQFGNGNVRINNDSSGRMYLRAPLAYYFEGNGGYKMVLDGNSGNLGIGTTSPSGLLHVSSGTSGDAVVIIEADTDNNNENDNPQLQFKQDAGGIVAKAGLIGDPGQIFTNSLGNGAYFGTDANASVQFYTNATAAFTIREDGDVGIGTTNPGKLLELSGGANAACIRLRDTTSNVWDIQNSTLGKLDFIRGGTNTYMRIDQFGNVGIGTTSPSGRLTIGSGATTDNSTMFNVNGQYNDVGFNGGTSGLLTQGVWSFINSATWDQTRFYVQDQNNSDSRLTFDFKGNAGNTNILAGTSSGNVGIGTTSPSYKLDISGDLRVDNGNIGSTSGDELTHARIQGARHFLDFKEIRTANDWDWKNTTFKIQTGVDATKHQSIDFVSDGSYQEHIDIRTGNQVFNTRFTYDGKVGIGTTSPSQKLHIYNGTAYVTPISYAANQAGYALRIGAYNNTNFDMGLQAKSTSGGSPYMSFKTSSADDALTIWGGSVGVGALPNPSYKLDINGTLRTVGDSYFDDDIHLGRYIFHAGDTNTWLGFPLDDTISFRTSGSDRMYINSSGNVGIGTTSPTSRLHVAQQLTSPTVPMVRFEATRTSSTYGAVNVRVDNLDYGTGMSFYRSGIYSSNAVSFYNGASPVGSINISTSSTSYNTTSDYRLKENLTEITDGIDRIKQLKPKRFNFIGDTSVVDGFIAHEAKQVVPEAVTGEKDEVLPNGDPVYQGIDQAKIVPLLTAALQEAITKIEVLENRLQILENK